MKDELQRQQEEQEATFRPVISVSQRRIQGTSRFRLSEARTFAQVLAGSCGLEDQAATDPY